MNGPWLRGAVDGGYPYLACLPTPAAEPWALVLFLHGSGERGSDLDRVLQQGLPQKVEAGARFPFLLVAPQCPAGATWTLRRLDAVLAHARAQWPVASDRIYVTGLSMGGAATWSFAARHPDLLAAIVPVCGGGNPRFARRLRHLPVWTFHGEDDDAMPIADTRAMVAELERWDAPVRFTPYANMGHDVWTQTYDLPELYAWLLQQRRRDLG
jgi:predicted peptidase